MSPSVTLSGLCCLLAALSAHSQDPQYGKLGDSVTFSPDLSSVTGPIGTIVWKHGPDLAMEWDGRETDAYRHFKDRGNLNHLTGVLSITGLMRNDSGVYTAEINGKVTTQTQLKVIAPVPKPNVTVLCDADVTSCVLSCNGDTTDAELVTYSWNQGNTKVTEGEKEYTITKEQDVSYTQISCTLENPVSRENSEPINNPFITAPVEPAGELKVKTGLIVFISLVAIVLVSVFVHRWKAGVWFFEKDVLPCQAEFWKKQEQTNQVNDAADVERPSAKEKKKARFKSSGKKDNGEAAESNGTGAAAEAGQPEENRLMTDDGKPTPDQEP